jgi:hypothetical protein
LYDFWVDQLRELAIWGLRQAVQVVEMQMQCPRLLRHSGVQMKGRRQVKRRILSLETIETWIVYVCHSEGEWAR